MKSTFLLCVFSLLIGCTDAGSPPVAGEFAIYTLQDRTIDGRTALSYPMKTLQLNAAPFLSASDLNWYSWSTHTFALKPEMDARWEEFRRTLGNLAGVPFVVTVGNERIYVGTFWWGYSSMTPPQCAVIQLLSANPYAILLMAGAIDYRNDWRIHTALMRSGILVD
jgi:hypothetical protein